MRITEVRVIVCFLLLTIAGRVVGLPLQNSAPPFSSSSTSSVISSGGIVVAEVRPGSDAEKAGLRIGDVLLACAGRSLSSPFALLGAIENCSAASDSKMLVKVKRGSLLLDIRMASGKGGLTVRPALSPEILSIYQVGLAEYDAQHWESAIAKWHSAFKASESARNKSVSGWLSYLIAECYQHWAVSVNHDNNLTEALTWIHRAWEFAKSEKDRAAQTLLLLDLGNGQFSAGNREIEYSLLERAYEFAVPDGNEAWVADARSMQASILLSRYVSHTDNLPGTAAVKATELAQALQYGNEALAIRSKLLPASLPLAESFRFLGKAALVQGHYADGQANYEKALGLYQRLAPQSANTAGILQEIGNLELIRGDIANAEHHLHSALAYYKGRDAASQQMQSIISSELAAISAIQGDLEQAKQSLQQALNTYPRTAPDYTMHRAKCLMILGIIAAVEQKDLSSAKQYSEQALALWQTMPAAQEARASTLNTLGQIAASENNPPEARQRYQEALDIGRAANPNSIGVGVSLNGLGILAYGSGHMADAQVKFEQARDIWRSSNSGASQDASAAANLGRVYLRQNRPDKALPLLEGVIATLEARRQRISDLDSRTLFMQIYGNPYADLMEAHLALQQPDKAFAILERMHARSFADNLAEWRLQLDRNLPQSLKDRQQKIDRTRRMSEDDLQRATEAKYNHAKDVKGETLKENNGSGKNLTGKNLTGKNVTGKNVTEKNVTEKNVTEKNVTEKNVSGETTAQSAIEQCAAQQRQLDAAIRQDYILRIGHDIEYPPPISLQAAQQSLPEGVLALAYAQDDDSVSLFALTKSSFRACLLPLPSKLLTDRIKQARELISDIHSTPQMTEGVLKDLYRDLLLPVQAEIANARALLICPDGALNLLPFAALLSVRGRFLIQDKPVTICASLTAYRSLRAGNRPPMTSLLALGDPTYNPPVQSRYADGRPQPLTLETSWERLEETGKLAREIETLYAPQSTVLLKGKATAANFLAECGQASIVHLGCHAVPDNRNPFGSWLALTPASKNDDGRLAAWQILHARLHARLVVLWGCETGLGKDNRYEGIQGLPRAFQTAGAANVLMTIWKVQPKETSRILLDFYHVCRQRSREGHRETTLAEALRQAQINAIKTDARPYFWASFVLNGVGE